MWAICSCHSLKKSNREQVTLNTLYKRMKRLNRSRHSLKQCDESHSLKECCEWFAHFLRVNRTFSLLLSKTSNSLNKICGFHHVFKFVLLLFPFRCSRHSLLRHSFLKSNREWFANHYFALLLTNNERFAQKNKERISNPAPWWLKVSAFSIELTVHLKYVLYIQAHVLNTTCI